MDPMILLSNYLVGQPIRLDFLDDYDGDVLYQFYKKSIPKKLKNSSSTILEFDLTLQELFFMGYYMIVGGTDEGDLIKLKGSDILYDFKKIRRILSNQEQILQKTYYKDNYKTLFKLLFNEFEQSFATTIDSVIELNQTVKQVINQPTEFQSSPMHVKEEEYDNLSEFSDMESCDDIDQKLDEMITKTRKLEQQLDEMILEEASDDDWSQVNEQEEITKENDELIKSIPNNITKLITNDDDLLQQVEDIDVIESTDYAIFSLPNFNQEVPPPNNESYRQISNNQSSSQLTFPPLQLIQIINLEEQDNRQRYHNWIRIITLRYQMQTKEKIHFQFSQAGNCNTTLVNKGTREKLVIKLLIIKKPSRRRKRTQLIFLIIQQQPKPSQINYHKDNYLKKENNKINSSMSQAQKNLPSNFLKILSEKPNNTDRLIIDSRRESPTIRKKLQGPQTLSTNFLQRRGILNKSTSNISQLFISSDPPLVGGTQFGTFTTLPRTLESTTEGSNFIQESPEIINFSRVSTIQNLQQNQNEINTTQQFKQKTKQEETESIVATNGSQFPMQIFQSYMIDSRTFAKEELVEYKENSLQIQFNIVKYFDMKPNLHLSRRPKLISTQHQLIALRYLITDSKITLPFDLTSVLYMEEKNQLILILPDIINLQEIAKQLTSLYIYDLRQNIMIQSPIEDKRKYIITRINSSQQAFSVTYVKPKEWTSLIQYIRRQNITELISNQSVHLYLPLQKGKLVVFSEKPTNTQIDNLYFHENKYEWK